MNILTTFIYYIDAEVFWHFNNDLLDLYSSFNGVGINGPIYQSPSYTTAGVCLMLTQSLSQSVTVNSPFLTIANTSFTFVVWMYANSLYNSNPYTDNYIIGQYEQSILDHALHIMIRNQRAYFGFFADDLASNQVSTYER
jgi:hypothetical protein